MTDVREHLEPHGLWRSREGRNWSEPVPIGTPCGARGRLSSWALAGLTQTIEAEIIPRLVMAHKTVSSSVPPLGSAGPGSSEVAGLVSRSWPKIWTAPAPNRNTARRWSLT